MTRDEALKLCNLIPSSAYTRDLGMGRGAEHDYAERLKKSYPEFNWRIILDRSGEYTKWRLTIDDKDKREHYVPVGGVCIHCGKTARQLGVMEVNDEGYEVEPTLLLPCMACGSPVCDIRRVFCEACWVKADRDELKIPMTTGDD